MTKMIVLNFYITIGVLLVCHNMGIISIICVSCNPNGYALQSAVGIIKDCVETRDIDEYQYDMKLLKSNGEHPAHGVAQLIMTNFIYLQNFSYLHIWALQRSETLGFDSKHASHTYIAHALSDFDVTACRMVRENNDSAILNQIQALALNTKIRIMIDAIRARASFTTPVIPMFDMRRDITDFSQPPCEQTVIIGVLGRLRFEVRLADLNQVHTIVDQHVLDDYYHQQDFMVNEVMKAVIWNAPHLTIGEKIVRSKQVENMKTTFNFNEQIRHFMRGNAAGLRNMCNFICKPDGMGRSGCLSGLVYLNYLRSAYPSIAWGKFGQKLFSNYEDVSLHLRMNHE